MGRRGCGDHRRRSGDCRDDRKIHGVSPGGGEGGASPGGGGASPDGSWWHLIGNAITNPQNLRWWGGGQSGFEEFWSQFAGGSDGSARAVAGAATTVRDAASSITPTTPAFMLTLAVLLVNDLYAASTSPETAAIT